MRHRAAHCKNVIVQPLHLLPHPALLRRDSTCAWIAREQEKACCRAVAHGQRSDSRKCATLHVGLTPIFRRPLTTTSPTHCAANHSSAGKMRITQSPRYAAAHDECSIIWHQCSAMQTLEC
jgi:hypothetical protein